MLGDALLERGDPRGELIQLQLAGRGTARVAELLAKHGRTWLDGLQRTARGRLRTDTVIGPRVFRRGFVARIGLQKLPNDAELALTAWRTVEELALVFAHPPGQVMRVLSHPHFAQLRVLDLSCDLLARLELDRELGRVHVTMPLALLPPRLRIRELIVTQGYVDDAPPAKLLAWIAQQPQAHALRSIVIEPSDDALAAAVAWLAAGALPDLARVALDADLGWPVTDPSEWRRAPWRIELARRDGIAVDLTWRVPTASRWPVDMIAALPRGSIASLTAHAIVPMAFDDHTRLEAGLAEAARHHRLPPPRLEPP